MKSNITTPLSFLISIAVLSGWFVTDFRFGDVVQVASVTSTGGNSNILKQILMSPAMTTPDIATNWFTGHSSNISSQLPAAQARNDDKDKYVSQGRILGDSVSSNDL